jgi:hypothetical protein
VSESIHGMRMTIMRIASREARELEPMDGSERPPCLPARLLAEVVGTFGF